MCRERRGATYVGAKPSIILACQSTILDLDRAQETPFAAVQVGAEHKAGEPSSCSSSIMRDPWIKASNAGSRLRTSRSGLAVAVSAACPPACEERKSRLTVLIPAARVDSHLLSRQSWASLELMSNSACLALPLACDLPKWVKACKHANNTGLRKCVVKYGWLGLQRQE